jgi:hypothetical protein
LDLETLLPDSLQRCMCVDWMFLGETLY